jgi:uncharacterized cupin superfamily protein
MFRPYHYEYEEEWLVALDGVMRVHTPDGEEKLERGEIVRFPSGPTGAHKVSSGSEATAHIMIVLERARAFSGRLSRQRQDRRLARQPRRSCDPAAARRGRRLLPGGELNPSLGLVLLASLTLCA